MTYPADPVETRGQAVTYEHPDGHTVTAPLGSMKTIPEGFTIKDSGERQSFESGMVRDVTEGKTDYLLTRDGPMYLRWAIHLTKGAVKYAKRNWMQANSQTELDRFRESAVRHFESWLNGERDEDHAAGVFFNINGAEYVEAVMVDQLYQSKMIDAVEAYDWRAKEAISDAAVFGPSDEGVQKYAHAEGLKIAHAIKEEACANAEQRATDRAQVKYVPACCGDPTDCGELCDGGWQ